MPIYAQPNNKRGCPMKQTVQQKGFAHLGLIIILIISLAAIAFGGWYVWNKNKGENKQADGLTQNSNQNQQTQQNQPNNASKEPVSSIPEGWKLYKNEQAGFSFYYPPEWGEVEKNDSGSFGFSKLSGSMSFQANRRDKKHTEGGFGVQVHNVIDVLATGDSAIVTFLTGVEPPLRKETYGPDKVIKKLSESRACVLEDVSVYEIYGDPDSANSYVFFGYCGLINDSYGAFALDSPGMDIAKSETQKLKEDITKLLQTFETF